MSRALSSQEQNWTTIEREYFAILATIKQYEYLLRNKFHPHTDYRNLIFLMIPPLPTVLRWKLAIQEYYFMVYHIEVAANVVADAF
jgi:hypothetical protein